jgi:hypothetical protein
VAGKMINVWMSLDPETERVSLQEHEPDDGSFPRGRRGRSWPIRRGVILESDWRRLLAAEMSPEEQDQFHLDAWERGAR